MKKVIRFIGLLLSLIIVLLSFSFTVSAQTINVNQYLMSIGVPEGVINLMSEGQKNIIYETLYGTDSEFSGYDIYNYDLTNDLEIVSQFSFEDDVALPCAGQLPSSDLTISVIGIKQNVTSNGVTTTRYAIYPSFVWNKVQKLAKDSFAMSMYPGWEVIPQMVNMRVHMSNVQGGSAVQRDYAPSYSASSGYIFSIPSNSGSIDYFYQGHAYFYATKTYESASPNISLTYVDDRSGGSSLAYGINLGIGSISVSSTSDSVYTLSGNYVISNIS